MLGNCFLSYLLIVDHPQPHIVQPVLLVQVFPHIMKLDSPVFRRKLVQWMPLLPVQRVKRIVNIMDKPSIGIYQKVEELPRGKETVGRLGGGWTS